MILWNKMGTIFILMILMISNINSFLCFFNMTTRALNSVKFH